MVHVVFLSGDHPEMGAFEFLQQLKAHVKTAFPRHECQLDINNRLLFIRVARSQKNDETSPALSTATEDVQVLLERQLTSIVPRLALCHEVGRVLIDVSFDDDLVEKNHSTSKALFSEEIFKKIVAESSGHLDKHDWMKIGSKASTFAVRIQKIGESAPKLFDRELSLRLARTLGSQIHSRFKGRLQVDLASPDLMFKGILSSTRFCLYLVVARSARRTLKERNPKLRPYSNPSILDPFLLRAMINMTTIIPGQVILDPFCGTGSLFIEAIDLGLLALGIELSRFVSWGASQNIKGLSLPAHLILSDARLMPLATNSVDAIVFDPPYGRGASTLGLQLSDLLQQALIQCERILKPQGYLAMSVINEVTLKDFLPPTSKLKLLKMFEWYVHRSMTRNIYIFVNAK